MGPQRMRSQRHRGRLLSRFSCVAVLSLCCCRGRFAGFAVGDPCVPRLAEAQRTRSSSLQGAGRGSHPLCRPPTKRTRERGGVSLAALPDLNLVSWFADELSQMPQHVADYGALGPLYFIAVAAVAESLTFPVTPMMLTSAFIFGMPLGIAVMLVSMSCAASIHFLLSRSLLRPSIEKLISGNQKVRAVNRAVEREGFRIMFLMRLEPLLPSSITNFAFGLSSASYLDFLVATFTGYAPYTLAVVSSVTILKDILGDGVDKPWYLYAVGALIYIYLLWLITDVASKAIGDAIKEDEVAVAAQGPSSSQEAAKANYNSGGQPSVASSGA